MNTIEPRMNTERRSRNRIVLVVVLVLVIEPRHPIEDEDEDEDDEEKFARRAKILRDSSTNDHERSGARNWCSFVVQIIWVVRLGASRQKGLVRAPGLQCMPIFEETLQVACPRAA